MKIYADLHIHSRYSIATSKLLIPSWLDFWARIKGITLLGTGDCIHPAWLNTLKEELEPAGEGLYRIKTESRLAPQALPFPLPSENPEVQFCLSTEVSTIFKRHGRVRKSHSLILLSSMSAADRLQGALEKTGNIRSDGRPILGLDVKHLLETVLQCDPEGMLIPAHIWTPWFSMLGSKSGFDSAEECFEDLSNQIFAVETGLSSDPAMNWCCSFLDRFQLISNSDAHSPEKLGRNATIFNLPEPLSFPALIRALKSGEGLAGTVDLFPQEGKYHFDGHRKCGVRFSPLQTLQHDGICPECGKPITKGVLYRVSELADRYNPQDAPNRRPSHQIVPMTELIASILKVGPASKRVKKEYQSLIHRLGPELPLLLDTEPNELEEAGEPSLAGMIRRIRKRKVILKPGFDGEFGTIDAGRINAEAGPSLFEENIAEPDEQPLISFDIAAFRKLHRTKNSPELREGSMSAGVEQKHGIHLNPKQQEAVNHKRGPCRIIAGPGSGKTRVLAEFIRTRISEGVRPERILALSFSNRAATELAERVSDCGSVEVSTFHKLGLRILEETITRTGREPNFSLLTESEAIGFAQKTIPGKTINRIIRSKLLDSPPDDEDTALEYNNLLLSWNAFDLADLIALPLKHFRTHEKLREQWSNRYDWILVDEAQDINRSQYNLLLQLAHGKHPNLVLVGDPDQAIYGFRGADAGLMGSLLRDYPDTSTIRLNRSYRCPGNILEAAAGILNNRTTLQGGDPGMSVTMRECTTGRSEAEWIARTIEDMLGGVRSFSRESGITNGEAATGTETLGDFAILCRTRAQFPALQEALGNHGISSSLPAVKTSEIAASLKQVLRFMGNRKLPLKQAWKKSLPTTTPVGALELLDSVEQALPQLIDAGLECIRTKIHRGESAAALLSRLSLEQEQDTIDPRAEAVALITMHAAKGLEFKNVFIPGCSGRLLPFSLYEKKQGLELTEEERLLFVAITRTKERLFLSWPGRMKIGGLEAGGMKSPFLARIRESLLEREQEEARPGQKNGQQELGF